MVDQTRLLSPDTTRLPRLTKVLTGESRCDEIHGWQLSQGFDVSVKFNPLEAILKNRYGVRVQFTK
jgi:hypothetical protein